jgi:excisionase family DNA binding protein
MGEGPRAHRYWAVKELAAELGVHPRTLQRWATKGLVRGYRSPAGGHWRFDPAEVREDLGKWGIDLDRDVPSDDVTLSKALLNLSEGKAPGAKK